MSDVNNLANWEFGDPGYRLVNLSSNEYEQGNCSMDGGCISDVPSTPELVPMCFEQQMSPNTSTYQEYVNSPECNWNWQYSMIYDSTSDFSGSPGSDQSYEELRSSAGSPPQNTNPPLEVLDVDDVLSTINEVEQSLVNEVEQSLVNEVEQSLVNEVEQSLEYGGWLQEDHHIPNQTLVQDPQPYPIEFNVPNIPSVEPEQAKPKRRRRCLKLWHWLLSLLEQPDKRDVIEWINRSNGVFRFVDSEKAAKMWGNEKKKATMSYNHMSRAIRHYYKDDIMGRVPGQRLVYKFCEKADKWVGALNGVPVKLEGIA